uniref:Uncharacterized protein n=1 Tax=Thermosporothrix sp. COM3 TaxID=2490863 RepID=A0A455SJU0_9CHLR|nr:hypothetical protein KTC_23790 [Thermosporothrix sp. COM3]
MRPEPIAIIGVGCRLPGNVCTLDDFWTLLCSGSDVIRDLPPERWDTAAYYHPEPDAPGKMYTCRGAFLNQIDLFDAAFFGITDEEAVQIDPQQRLLLETCWEAMEDAGLLARQLAGSSTGVFIGISAHDYSRFLQQDPTLIDAYSQAGTAHSFASNRISGFFDLHGPSLSIDTACSSSLVAVHLACESLRRGECQLAFAGGVNLLLDPIAQICACKTSWLSPSAHCQVFDADADGAIRGEGAGVILLKPLAHALADGNRIHAIIRASGTNQDGRRTSTLNPTSSAQEALLRRIYREAAITPAQVHYVEAHATGTPLHDSAECYALGTALGLHRYADLWIDSVKAVIGHLGAAAGIAGLLKTVLILKHRQLPANPHFKQPGPYIPFASFRLRVPQQLTPLEEAPLLAGVNSIGSGGTNAHVLLEEFQTGPEQKTTYTRSGYLLPLSAQSHEGLVAQAHAYRRFAEEPISLHDMCSSALFHRDHFSHRLALVFQSQEELREQLDAFLTGDPYPLVGRRQGITPKIAFVFCGIGSQWWGMAHALFEQEPVFRAAIERYDPIVQRHAGWSLMRELLADSEHSRIHHADIVAPAFFAFQVALVELWKAHGVEPQATIGHSMGALTAAHVAGLLTFEEALHLFCFIHKILKQTENCGRMLAASLPEEQALALLADCSDTISLAAINSPQSVTLSGDAASLHQIASQLEQQGIFCRYLPLDYTLHSHAMDPLREEFINTCPQLPARLARRLFVSTVTGKAQRDGDAAHWWNCLHAPVRFADGVHTLLQEGYRVFLEIGPHPVLSGYLSECLQYHDIQGLILPTLHRKDPLTPLRTMGALYVRGWPLRWKNSMPEGKLVPLPHYPWQRRRYWLTPRTTSCTVPEGASHPLLGRQLATALPIWETTLETQLPGGLLMLLLAVAGKAFGAGPISIEQFMQHELLRETACLQIALVPPDNFVHLFSRHEQQEWSPFARARISQPSAQPAPLDQEALKQRCSCIVSSVELQFLLWSRGIRRSPVSITEVRCSADRRVWLCRTDNPSGSLESALQQLFSVLTLFGPAQHDTRPFIPIALERLSLYQSGTLPTRLYHLIQIQEKTPACFTVNITLFDTQQTTLLEAQRLRLQALPVPQQELPLHAETWHPAAGCSSSQTLSNKVSLETLLQSASQYHRHREPAQPSMSAFSLQPHATYLLTGALESIGPSIAAWLIARGARHLTFAAPTPPRHVLELLQASSARYCFIPTDLAAPEAVARLLNELKDTLPPLRGIIHLTVTTQHYADEAARRADQQALWNLHIQTQSLPLDLFLLFSGHLPGDRAETMFPSLLAAHRRMLGLPALSFYWGELTQSSEDNTAWQVAETLPFEQALARLESYLQGPYPHLFIPEQTRTHKEQHTRFFAVLNSVLGITVSRSMLQRSATELGLDSLKALQLSSQLKRELGLDISVLQVLQASNLAALLPDMQSSQESSERRL